MVPFGQLSRMTALALLTILVAGSSQTFASKCESQNFLLAFRAALEQRLRSRSPQTTLGTSNVEVASADGSAVQGLHFHGGSSNNLVVDAETLFPCGISSVFSLKIQFRWLTSERSVILSVNKGTSKPLLDISIVPKSSVKLSIKGTAVDSPNHPPLDIDMSHDIRFNTTHTLVLRVDRHSARARVDCGHWRIIGFPGLLSVPPEDLGGINVRVGCRRRSQSHSGTHFFEGIMTEFLYYTDPAEANAITCDESASARQRHNTRGPSASGNRALVGEATPMPCRPASLGITWYNTKSKALMVCDGVQWSEPRKSGQCSVEYIDHYQDFEFSHIVDFEPFRMLITDRLSEEERRSSPVASQYEPFVVASRMDYNAPAPRACKLSIVYRWGRDGGWHAYDHLPRSICNAGYAKSFSYNGVEFLAVLDRGADPKERIGSVVVFRWRQDRWDHQKRMIQADSSVIAQVDVTSEWAEQFDVFHIGARTFIGVAEYRHSAPCSSYQNRQDDCAYEAHSTVYELRETGALRESAVFRVRTQGATKVKHVFAPELDEHFLFVSNSMDATSDRSTAGNVLVYRWSAASGTFEQVQVIPAEGVSKLETFLLKGTPHVVFSSFVSQRMERNPSLDFTLTAPIYRYDALSRQFKLSQAIDTDSSTGVRYASICGRPMLALTSRSDPNVDHPPSTSYLYAYKGILGFKADMPLSLNKVWDVEHVEINGQHYLLTSSQDNAPSQTLKVVTSS